MASPKPFLSSVTAGHLLTLLQEQLEGSAAEKILTGSWRHLRELTTPHTPRRENSSHHGRMGMKGSAASQQEPFSQEQLKVSVVSQC